MKDFKYYTLFGVRLRRGDNMIPKYDRDFLLRWTSHERTNADRAKAMVDNKMFKTTDGQAIAAVGIGNEAHSIHGIKLRVIYNPEISSHLYETDFVLTDEWLDLLIDSANYSDHGKKMLAESKIRL